MSPQRRGMVNSLVILHPAMLRHLGEYYGRF